MTSFGGAGGRTQTLPTDERAADRLLNLKDTVALGERAYKEPQRRAHA